MSTATGPRFLYHSQGYNEFEVEDGSSSSSSSRERSSNPCSASLVEPTLPTVPTNANHLLLIALLEHMCSLYIHNPRAKQKLFKLLCQQLAVMNIMSPLCSLDELGAIKSQYKKSFAKLFNACVVTLNLGNKLALPSPYDDPIKIFTNNRLPSWRLPKPELSDFMSFHTSRYREEFDECCTLGKGAYGSVYKAKHKLDGRLYAVKKVIFQDNTPEMWCKTLREVKHLADLNHPSVIRYYTAWLEYDLPSLGGHKEASRRHHDDFDLPALTYVTEISKQSSTCDSSNSSSIIFDSKYSRVHSLDLSESNYRQKSLPHPSVSKSEGYLIDNSFVVLHIQMELCQETLQDWIQTRNHRSLADTEVDSVIDNEMNIYILREVLAGVQHLHQSNLIHRDLKPSNIFLNHNQATNKLTVKIGDFGLVRCHSSHSGCSGGDVIPQSPLTPNPGVLQEGQLDMNGLFLTSGVGTTIYASPEQLAGVQYGPMSDMYSVGMILFELYHPFSTAMERSSCLMDLRKGIIPAEFTQQWPKQTIVTHSLVDGCPCKRQSAEDVLSGPLFNIQSQSPVKLLIEQLAEKDIKLAEKDIQLAQMDIKLTEKESQLDVYKCQNDTLLSVLTERDTEIECLKKLLNVDKSQGTEL